MKNVEATIDLSALRHNFHRIAHYAPQAKVIAMVKGNAYGHGIESIARALSETDAFGVSRLSEALALRKANIKKPIILFSYLPTTPQELQVIAEQRLELVVQHELQIELLEKTSLKHPIDVWLKVDSGMHRLGLAPEKIAEAYQRLKKCSSVNLPIRFLTHLADADDLKKKTTLKQIECFTKVAPADAEKSIANSAGIVAWPQTHADWVRPGIMLYGVSPMQKKLASDFQLKPVMTLRAPLLTIQNFKKGDAIGYGGNWVCPENMPVGMVAIGYGDGYPRHAKNGTPTLLAGVTCPVIGRVSMDLISIDLRNCAHAKMGDEVILWGEGLPAEIVAESCDTIAYELFCKITARVTVRYLDL